MGQPAYFVAPWHLNRDLDCIPRHPGDGSIVLVESVAKSRALPYHKKKLVFILSAMHHFVEDLQSAGFDVEIVRAPTYLDGIAKHVAARKSPKVIALEPREWGMAQAFERAASENRLKVPLELRPDRHFLVSRDEFEAWAHGRKHLRMADFYRWMRKRTGFLMDRQKPVGGKWSFDTENRQHARGESPPDVPAHPPDEITRVQMKRVARWKNHWGEVTGFGWPVTRQQALLALDRFFAERAKDFGRYQDAMLFDRPFMWHALMSAALNVSLLSPAEICARIVAEYETGRMPLSAAEGLLRQILGWREFIRGVYWLRMPGLRDRNLLNARRPLPDFFWEPEKTELTCLQQSIGQVLKTGYAHHIQRLMVQGNFALLAGVDPLEISHWFWAGFVDAYEWVELPNVHGMAVYADDTFTTKPYAASGNYIHRMSDYCRHCPRNVKARSGDDACPFNSMFWAFMDRHRARFEANPRLRMLYRTWDRLPEEERSATLQSARTFLASLNPPTKPWTFDDDAC